MSDPEPKEWPSFYCYDPKLESLNVKYHLFFMKNHAKKRVFKKLSDNQIKKFQEMSNMVKASCYVVNIFSSFLVPEALHIESQAVSDHQSFYRTKIVFLTFDGLYDCSDICFSDEDRNLLKLMNLIYKEETFTGGKKKPEIYPKLKDIPT